MKTEREVWLQCQAQPIRGDVAVQGGGTWGGFGNQESERKRAALKVCEQRRRVRAEKPHLQESWTIHRPMETGVSDVTPAGWLREHNFNTM
ncbi:hypothetical protein EPR50_G00171640 [Perca flavescens]|uniref:Uncharacterized protein n=1 Tax=Perca flavescens TaxID=8167 RepID=A0A484CEH0_PERFV|nr:hypothetical protein EPR50_G00171640 [Perca flavescens]